MAPEPFHAGLIRKLWVSELDKFCDHLLRLDEDSLRLRFGMKVDRTFLENYATFIAGYQSVIYAYIAGGKVRAAAELRPLGDGYQAEAEAAFSVETPFQDTGIGTALMGRIIRAARNRGITRIFMNCLTENRKMQHVARKYAAELHFDHGEVVGRLAPTTPNYFSIWREAVEDEMGFVMAVLDLQRRMLPAA